MTQDKMDTTSGKIPMRTHWIPRFLAAGVDYFDLQALLKRIDKWDVWCQEWSATAAMHEEMGLEALARSRFVTAGQALGRAAAYYHFAGFRFYEDMTQKDQADRKAWETYRKAAPYLQPPAERIAVPFAGTHLVGYLRLPPGVSRAPCVIIIAGMDSRKEEMRGLENEFLARGMATVTYDGPGQGETWENVKIHGDRGDTVERDVAERAAREAGGPTKLLVFEEGDHLCINIRNKSWPVMMDWFAEQLAV